MPGVRTGYTVFSKHLKLPDTHRPALTCSNKGHESGFVETDVTDLKLHFT